MNFKSIVTHPGVFHADDAMSVALTNFLTGTRLPVERRNPTSEELEDPSVLVLDVGGIFDPSRSDYDHHLAEAVVYREPKEGYGTKDGLAVPMAAFGMLWHNFPLERVPTGLQPGQLDDYHVVVDRMLVRAIDAADCGWKPRLRMSGGTEDVGPRPDGWAPPKHGHCAGWYSVEVPSSPVSCSLSQAISWLNPGTGASPAERDAAFGRAVEICSQILEGVFRNAAEHVLAKAAVMSAESVDGRVLVLQQFVPWQEHIFVRPDQDQLQYVVFPSERGGFMLQQIPVALGSFEGRKPLPAPWAGLRDSELRNVTGVADAVFCHPGRFCGGAESLEGTLAMAKLAVQA
jgi:uncharacterized UPF0160 family protein